MSVCIPSPKRLLETSLYRISTSLKFNQKSLLFANCVLIKKKTTKISKFEFHNGDCHPIPTVHAICFLAFNSEHGVFCFSHSCMKALLRQTNLTVSRSEKVTSDHDEDLIFVPTK